MNAQEHVYTELKKLSEPVERTFLEGEALEDELLTRVLAKKFRKLKADEELIATTKKAVHFAVEEGKPVTLGLLFGGNKLWRFDEAPEIDWAELFTTIYFLRLAKHVAGIYEHGAQVMFYSQDVSVQRLNNVPRTETDNYSRTFRLMLEWLKPYMPEGVSVVYRRHAEEYADVAEYDAELEAAMQAMLADNNGKLPTLTEEQKTATELNVRLLPGQDDDPEWREKVELQHQAIFSTKTLAEGYLSDPYHVPLSPTYYPGCLITGSTPASMAKFWAGVGALRKDGDHFTDLVLSPKQVESAVYGWQDVQLEGLQGKNFSRIRIIAG
jgi:hypothetical protein